MFELATILVVVAALASYANHRFLKLPNTIGVMAIGLALSLILIALGSLGLGGVEDRAASLLEDVDFDETLLHGMLAFLLFAGALHIDLGDLAKQKRVIGMQATIGVVLSAAIVAGLSKLLFPILGLELGWLDAFLFGALISPTDPVAVLGILKQANAPKSLATKMAGESLFNDGVGVVVFLVLLGIAKGGGGLSTGQVALLFVEEAVGGVLLGLVLGYVVFRLLRRVDEPTVEVLLTLALVMGGYALALAIHTSGPILVVVAGLLIGNHGRRLAMSDRVRQRLDTFWELVDEILNAVLFVLVGLEVLLMPFSTAFLLAGLVSIPVVLFARFASVGSTVTLLRASRTFTPGAVRILTWGGLRGGISVALALSIPADFPTRDLLLAATYAVVVFSILVQGLTVGPVVKAATGRGMEANA